ncbi:hypothetical protein BUFA31_08200 [Butyricicoccus faecihominis]|uniref:Uncharacterized protein n=1 Tax=Butyricicoccus faecihominis TaxID=1712515 RepID=A0ABQ1DY65_9FIRM|nr:hypothetical protein BUFA31_08200 [Butyricicoccus faecihominis]
MHTAEWTFLYANLGGTAEVTGFCPMIRLYHRTEAFFIASTTLARTQEIKHDEYGFYRACYADGGKHNDYPKL